MASQEATGTAQEPLMYLQRPSSGKSQDVRHVLARTFRELYQRDAVTPETVRNLNRSRAGDDQFHQRYVEQLQKVYEERERRMTEAAMLERHIMQAQARATSADERAIRHTTSGVSDYDRLGLPSVESNFRSCLDTALLRTHGLITPDDYTTDDHLPRVPPPRGSPDPEYARATHSSRGRRGTPELDAGGDGSLAMEEELHFPGSDRATPEPDEFSSLIGTAKPVTKKQTKSLWKKEPPFSQRNQDRADISLLQRKVAYLQNPRHGNLVSGNGLRSLLVHRARVPKEIGIETEQEPPEEAQLTFLVSPPVLTFREYNVGQIYELRLEVKNVSSVLQQVRLVPPRSSYFAAGLGQFPGDHGLVAPGMSCIYPIRFAPDSLADYDDAVTIQTQGAAEPIIVNLEGRRPPPVLTLPEKLDVGQCIVGGKKLTQFIIRNEGGPGRFCFMPRSAWPSTNFKTNVYPAFVGTPPFEIRPAVFELGHKGTMMLEVLFAPTVSESSTEEVTLICDNCHVKHLRLAGTGVIASVQLGDVEGGFAEREAGEMRDATADHLIRFEELNAFTFVQKRLTVVNPLDLEMGFTWKVCKPCVIPSRPDEVPEEDEEEEEKMREMIVDFDSSFSVNPNSGALPPSGRLDFDVTFAPPEIEKYHSVLHLVLQNIPQPQGPNEKPVLPRSASTDSLTGSRSSLNTLEPTLLDITGLEIEVKGVCVPLDVCLDPYAILVPGHMTIGTTVRRPFRLINSSMCIIAFQWQCLLNGFIVQVEPPLGELPPGLAVEQEVIITPTVPGTIDTVILCYVEHMDEPLRLRIQGEIKGPEVVFDQPNLDFGLIRLGTEVTQEISISNNSQVAAEWSLVETETTDTSGFVSKPPGQLTFSETSGQLKPVETRKIAVTFRPVEKGGLKAILDLVIKDGVSRHLNVFAETQLPQACLRSCQLTPEEVYVGVPTQHRAQIINQTLLDASFAWQPPVGEDAKDCLIEMIPQCGILRGHEELEVVVNFTANREGEVTDVLVPCKIESMDVPLCLAISCDVRGLSVTLKTPEPGQDPSEASEDDLLVNFGASVAVGANPRRFLHVQNNSAIAACFSVEAEHFYARPPSPPEKKPDFTAASKNTRRHMLSKTPNLGDPLAKSANRAHTELCASILRDSRGAAFVMSPASGELGPFGSQTIDVTVFSDMYGEYSDNLVLKIEGMPTTLIPIQMTVVGCPLVFQMTAPNPEQTACLRFGSHVSGLAPVKRSMRINNPSPYDVRVDWRVFDHVPGDEKLLDFTVFFGDAFPLRDQDGEEIEPTLPEPAAAPRPPTAFIPNSPDSTPAHSRAVTATTQDLTLRERVRPKIARVHLEPHEGIIGDSIFRAFPQQMVVPPRSSTNLCMTFAPFTSKQEGQHRLGYALGYISLDDPRCQTEGHATRLHGYDVTPLRLDLSAHVKPPYVHVECVDEEGMEYRVPASDMLVNGQPGKPKTKGCTAVLTNTTEAVLQFVLSTTGPFCLVDLDPADGKVGQDVTYASTQILLRPRRTLQVKVGFRVTESELSLVNRLAPGRPHPDLHVTLEAHKTERRLVFKDLLQITFNNGTVQSVPLEGILIVPQFTVNHEELDFGTCLVGQTKQLQFVLTNKTASGSSWTASIESCSDTCTPETFVVSPSCGQLPPHVTHVTDSSALVDVTFTAKHSEVYEAILLVKGSLGEGSKRVLIHGEGSYDGKHEAVMHVINLPRDEPAAE